MSVWPQLMQRAPVTVRDLIGLAGAASIIFGVWEIYAPAGFIVGGLFGLAGAAMAAWIEARSADDGEG